MVLGVKALAGGAFVVLFSLVSSVLGPKMFAGLFSAAPSVALASLLVTSLQKGPAAARPSALGMAVGSAGMLAYCLCAYFLVRRLGALAGSVAAWGVWLLVAAGLYLAVTA